jgi:hypothetical protein
MSETEPTWLSRARYAFDVTGGQERDERMEELDEQRRLDEVPAGDWYGDEDSGEE